MGISTSSDTSASRIDRHTRHARARSLVIVAGYVVFGALWIVFSDQALYAVFSRFEDYVLFQTVKGLFFVTVTAVLLLIVSRHRLGATARARLRAEEAYQSNELLLREMHHRIKNNLQFVLSLLSLQIHASRSDEVREALLTTQKQIQALSHVNSELYRDAVSIAGNNTVSLESLVSRIVSTYEPLVLLAGGSLDLESTTASIRVTESRAVPIALCVHELSILAVKSSQFRPGDSARGPDFSIVASVQENSFVLRLKHNGPADGVAPETPDSQTPDSQTPDNDSLEMLGALVSQLGGELLTNTDGGSIIAVRVPQSLPEPVLKAGKK